MTVAKRAVMPRRSSLAITTILIGCALSNVSATQAEPPAGTGTGAHWPPKSYAIYYGPWDLPTLQKAQEFGCVVFHPGQNFSNISPEMVRRLRAGKDGQLGTSDDVLAIAYVSIGEDENVPSGPLRASKEPLAGPTVRSAKGYGPSRKGYPSKYLDEMTYVFDSSGLRKFGENGKPLMVKGHDGIPDENGVWGSFYTYPGDAAWQSEILQRFEQIRSANGTQTSNSSGVDDLVDGFFLDTLDTSSPWGNYGDTQAEMAKLLVTIRAKFPRQKIVANRGMFLIDKHSQEYNRSVDGVLFESMYTIWDWARGAGILSPWCRGDYYCFRDQLAPAASKSGYSVFFVNYINPQQSDFANYLRNSSDLIAGRGLEYVADPGLQKLFPRFEDLTPPASSTVPQLGGLSVLELGNGRFRLSFDISGMERRQLGKDFFLDLRLSKEPLPAMEPCLVNAIPFDYSSVQQVEAGEGKLHCSIESFGLDKATNYWVYLRGFEKGRGPGTSPYLNVSLKTADAQAPAQMEELTAVGLDSSVRLKWKNSSLVAKKFRVYMGDGPDRLRPISLVDQSEFRMAGLQNGKAYFFSVAGVDSSGQEGAACLPVATHPEDCLAPDGPAGLTAESSAPGTIRLTWGKCSSDCKTLKVYCAATKENYRIPARLSADLNSYEFKGLMPGSYWVAVAGVDANGNETQRPQRVTVQVR